MAGGAGRKGGVLDYYRQFRGMSDEEISAELRKQADERRMRELARIEPLDLSQTTWPEFPHPDVVAAVTYAARRGINRYPEQQAAQLRRALADRHGVPEARVVAGHGAAQLLDAAARTLLAPGDELVTWWPSYALYPLSARAVGATAVPVPGRDAEALLGAITGRTRVVCICNPNDPTGAYLPSADLDALLAALPEEVTLLLDEALIDYVTEEPLDSSLALLERHRRLLVFRTFSKAHALAGLRCGYVLGGQGSEALLERIEPPLGLDALSAAGALEALRLSPHVLARRTDAVIGERARLLDELGDLPVEAAPSEANFVWLATATHDATRLAADLERFGVIVATGTALGAADHVRAAVQSPQASDRLLRALRSVLSGA